MAGKRGRPQIKYRLRLAGPIVTCQFDGTQLAGAIFDTELNVKAFKVVALKPLETIEEAVEQVKGLLTRLKSCSAFGDKDLPGLALAINAVQLGGRTVASSVLRWADDVVEGRFSQALNTTVKFISSPALPAECQKLSGPVPGSLVRLNVGDGVSAHAAIFGQIYQGGSSLAGELGHIIVDPDGPLCGCGRRGCLEAYCSGPGIYRKVLTDLDSGVLCGLDIKALVCRSPREAMDYIWQAWQNGDNYARALMEEVFGHLGWALGLLMNLLDPELIVIGGYVLGNRKMWIEEIRRHTQRWVFHSAHRKTRFKESRITLEDELRVIGSYFYYDGAMFNHPAIANKI